MEVTFSSWDVVQGVRFFVLVGVAVGLAAILIAELIPSTFDPVISPALFILGAMEFAFLPFLFYFLMRGLARHILVNNTFLLLSFFFAHLRLGIGLFMAVTITTIVLSALFPEKGLPFALYGAGAGIIGTLVLMWNELIADEEDGP